MFTHILKKNKLKIIGLMSGTSCDGLDIALIETCTDAPLSRFKFIKGKTFKYSTIQRNGILDFIRSESMDLKAVSQINFYLAEVWAEMVVAFLQHVDLRKEDIDLIGSHGQTIWHQPEPVYFIDRNLTSTLQLGDPAVLAQLTGIPVIGDFRVADVALGGQGAPLIPYFDWIYFSQFRQNILAVNIGGISNFTFIPSNSTLNELIAFDCGPGNMLIDQAMQILFNQKFDTRGEKAAQGRYSEPLFQAIRGLDSFVDKAPPKSSGREHYNHLLLKEILKKADELQLNAADTINTISAYTAYAIHSNYMKFISAKHTADVVVVGGGGAANPFLIKSMQYFFQNIPVKTVSEYHLDEEFKEAIGFAILAHESLFGKSTNVPQVTHASRSAILGKFCPV